MSVIESQTRTLRRRSTGNHVFVDFSHLEEDETTDSDELFHDHKISSTRIKKRKCVLCSHRNSKFFVCGIRNLEKNKIKKDIFCIRFVEF